MSSTAKKTKTFDCVAFKHQAQARVYEATRELPADERRQQLRSMVETGPLADFWKSVTQQARTAPKAGRL